MLTFFYNYLQKLDSVCTKKNTIINNNNDDQLNNNKQK